MNMHTLKRQTEQIPNNIHACAIPSITPAQTVLQAILERVLFRQVSQFLCTVTCVLVTRR